MSGKGKFAKLVLRNGDAVLEGRGSRMIKLAENAQKSLIQKLEDEITQLEDKQEMMLDNSPDNRYSLKVGEAFDANGWAAEYQTISLTIVNKKVELEIAKKNSAILFEGESND